MKKIIAIFLAVIMCLAIFAACDKKKGSEETTTAASGTSANTETVTEPAGSESGSESEPESGTTPTPDVEYDVEAAVAYLNTIYKKYKENNVTGADFNLVSQVMIAGVPYTVDWASDNEKVKPVKGESDWKIDLEHKTAEEYSYTLTATVTAGDGTTATFTLSLVVPVYNVATFEEYMAAEKGTNMVVEGIVVAMNAKSVGNSRNHLFLADVDGKGGYYCYQLDMDPVAEGVKVGMTVAVTSVVEPYSGMQELKGGTFAIVDETIKTVDVLDITDKFVSGADLKNYVGLPVTIKGVTIKNQVLGGTSDYLNFELEGKTAYVRSYVTDFPTTLTIVKGENNTVTSPDKTAIETAHAEKFGWTANATGILVLYSGNPYLIPMSVDCFEYLELKEMTPAEKIAAELADVKVDTNFSSDAVVDLPAVGKYYSDIALTWTVEDATGAATIANGKLTITVPDTKVTVKVTVTATLGDVSDTKVFEVTLSKGITSIKDAIEIATGMADNDFNGAKYYVAGIITEVYNTTYGNIRITDEFGNIFTIYGSYSADGTVRYDAMENKPVAGDYIVVYGAIGRYGTTYQIKNGWIMSCTTPTTIPEAIEIGAAKDSNTYTEDKYIITGEIVEVQNATYGNVVIKDAAGNTILVYGLYSADGAVRYDKMATKPAVGDTITVLGILGRYNDTKQMKNGWLVAHTVATTNTPDGGEDGGETGGETGGEAGGEGAGSDAPAANSVVLTVDSLAIPSNSYTASTATVNGATFEFVQIGNYGDGIQMRDKDGKTSILWNTTAFDKPIARIELVYSSTKDVQYANADAVIYTFGNAVGEATYTTKLSTTAGVKTYTITPDAETYTFFKLEHDLGYTMYWESITIVFAD